MLQSFSVGYSIRRYVIHEERGLESCRDKIFQGTTVAGRGEKCLLCDPDLSYDYDGREGEVAGEDNKWDGK